MATRQYVTQLGRPAIDKAFDGLRTITRISDVKAAALDAATIEAEVFLAYATSDAEFPLALLVKRSMQQVSLDHSAYVGRLTEVYQEFTDDTKVDTGDDVLTKSEDGRTSLAKHYVILAEDAEAQAAAIGTVLDGRACANVQINKQGVGAEIVETYISAGILRQSTQLKNQGKLEIRSVTYYNGTPATPAGFTLITTNVENPDGIPGRTYIFAKGEGLVSQSIGSAPAGLRRVTNVSLGTKVTPTGIVTDDDYREDDGYTVYTVTSIQTAAGGADPTTITLIAGRMVNFTYPGRAKAYTETFDGKLMLASFLSPPITTLIPGTVEISYVTNPALTTPGNMWAPRGWATIRKQWVGSYGKQTSEIRALPGYRSVDVTPVSHVGTGTDSSIEGSVIYNGTEARIVITGGPADPVGNSYTLDAEIDPHPVFTSVAGTSYYRKNLVKVSAIPAQDALPV